MRVLILEDDSVLSGELGKFLSSHDIVSDKVFDGERFLATYTKKEYDMYLLDINVPKFNGLEVCERIRQTDKKTPIIILSAYGDLSDKKDAFGRLADDYLVKPFQFEELLMRMYSLVRRQERSKEQDEDVIEIADLKILKNQHSVFRGNQEIVLTVKEFQLLLFLAEAKGATVSKQQITEHVWEHNFSTNTNTVEVYINFLRKKVDKGFPVKLIHTRSGFGYYISAIQ